MKRIFLFIATIAICCSAMAQSNFNPAKARKAVSLYLIQYPQATLQDVYKSCYQDYFGPSHLVKDTKAAKENLVEEVQKTKVFGGPLYEYTGIDGNFVRVNLSLLQDNTVPIDQFFDLLAVSANRKPMGEPGEWIGLWMQIYKSLPESFVKSEANTEIAHQLESNLKKGEFVSHHTQQYMAAYNFHYRIIARDLFEKEMLPVIEQKYGLR